MAIALLMTSSLMIILYTNYCDFLNQSDDVCEGEDLYGNYPRNYPPECGDNEAHFLILPMFGFAAMVAWVSYCVYIITMIIAT